MMMEDTIHILLIEDDPAHAELIQRAFEDRGDRSRLTTAYTLSEAREHLKNFQPSLIIADWRLPDGDSSELLNDNEDDNPTTAIIIMTSYGNERNAVDVVSSTTLTLPPCSSILPRVRAGPARQSLSNPARVERQQR